MLSSLPGTATPETSAVNDAWCRRLPSNPSAPDAAPTETAAACSLSKVMRPGRFNAPLLATASGILRPSERITPSASWAVCPTRPTRVLLRPPCIRRL